jgi:2-C-methyl-D-erythritol 4-phosphate cytidylyltransferase
MNIALLTAAGSGTRTHQDIPKQFIHVNNKPILIYTLEKFQQHPGIDEICVVILKGWEDILWAYAKQFNITKLKYVVCGGETGQDSIYNGLEEILKYRTEDDVVMVHDGNRPMVGQDIITDSLVKFRKYGNAVAVIPCTEVVFTTESGTDTQEMLDRDVIVRTQTPHTYRLGDLWDAHQQARERGIKNTAASCMLMHELGKRSYFSMGSEKNIKITTVDDIEIFKALLSVKCDDWLKERGS